MSHELYLNSPQVCKFGETFKACTYYETLIALYSKYY